MNERLLASWQWKVRIRGMDSSDTDDNLISPTVDDLPVGEDESVQDSGAKAPARHRPRDLKPQVWLGLT